jgi:hypothetical protein
MMSRKMLLGLGVGAAIAYFTSPKRRRDQVKDQFMRASETARKAFDSTRRRVTDRTSSLMDNTRTHWDATPQRVSSR